MTEFCDVHSCYKEDNVKLTRRPQYSLPILLLLFFAFIEHGISLKEKCTRSLFPCLLKKRKALANRRGSVVNEVQ